MRWPLLLMLIIFGNNLLAQEFEQTGKASYYANKFEGRLTANGEVFTNNKLTAAHRTLPFGTQLVVINLSNNKHVKVTINDRGPFVKGRIIDVSRLAAQKLDFVNAGIARVRIEKAHQTLADDELLLPIRGKTSHLITSINIEAIAKQLH